MAPKSIVQRMADQARTNGDEAAAQKYERIAAKLAADYTQAQKQAEADRIAVEKWEREHPTQYAEHGEYD